MMMTKKVMRIKREGTGPINWILFSLWLVMLWVWETCGGFHISPSKMEEVRETRRGTLCNKINK